MIYDDEFRSFAIEYYYAAGSFRKAAADLGIAPGSLHSWVAQSPGPGKSLPLKDPLYAARYPKETIRLILGLVYGWPDWKLKEASDVFGISISTIHTWKKRYIEAGKMPIPVLSEDEVPPKRPWSSYKQDLAEEDKLIEIHKLKLKVAVLEEKLSALKDEGIDDLSNLEKAEIVDALRQTLKLAELLRVVGISSSSFYYSLSCKKRPDKYKEIRKAIAEEFHSVRGSRGYRYINHRLRQREEPIRVSEKVVRRLMAEDGLSVAYARKKRRWSSYLGEISEAPENIVKRNFHADKPNQLWLTDITEFSIGSGKVYLSPILDCYDGALVSWSIGRHPSAELANESLNSACAFKGEGDKPVCHSDRGGHYRWPGWIEICEKNNIVRSMSKKGCSPDNSSMEGFFGRLKNEFFYYNDWSGCSIEEFMAALDSYLHYYNEQRPKESLGWLSPMEHRRSLGFR